ncbi:tyrosine-type recombinase/integrase [Pseudomonas viridiflava]|uniref:tyrosine-type recombinase/integrase n=1 Tax=Pseudomonas viridiflava TaxID=33069 RepID=UPI001FD47507|nr:tyrosine-type recombinase/integrase [Pseudomonas viridiflava]
MNLSSPRSAVTTTVTNLLASQGPTTRLAVPYHYRRNGIYYLRLRATGSTTESASVSLKTSNRRAALDASDQLSGFIRAFHRENPTALWSELKEHFLSVSAEVLGPKRLGESSHAWGALHADGESGSSNLEAFPSSSLQLVGDVSSSQLMRMPAMTFEVLSGLYMADRAGEQKANTLSGTKFTHGVLCSALGSLDLRMHSRADLISLRDQLAITRKPSTVNQMLMKLSAVLNWAVANGHLEKAFDKKLKFTKGLESNRKALSQDQVGKLMQYANNLPETSWKRWLLSLAIITGGRLNEISQLTTGDIHALASGITCIHINEAGEGKSIKNKRSERMVPLTNGAYGFDLAAFLRYVEACKLSGSESLAQIGYRPAGEWANQQAIPAALGDSYERGLVFHSLRHSLASLMQAKGVPTTYAQAVMGHASGTITFDTYGSGVPVQTVAAMLSGVFFEVDR